VFLTIGQYRNALNEFERMRAMDSTSSLVWLGMGRAQEGLGRVRDAVHSYEVYTQREPGDAAGFELLGRALASLGRHDDALTSFRKAQRLDPESPSAQVGAALALRALGRNQEALRSLRLAARRHPDDAITWGQLASVSLDLGHDVEAASYWEEALRRDPGYFDDRSSERTVWERVIKDLGTRPPRPDIAVSADLPPRSTRADSGGPTVAKRDTTGVVVASPFFSPFLRAARSSGFASGPSSSGTGFVVSRDAGLVLTNKHVVRACGQVRVRVDGKSRVASVQAIDADDDLALLHVALPPGTTATFRQDPAVRPGDDVVAVGYPLAGLLADQANVSTGSVNALAGLYNDLHLLQMSTPVQPGSSGGALLDASGNVVGVVVTKLNAKVVAEETGDIPQNVNFAVKASVAREFLNAHGVAFHTAPSTTPRSNADVGEIGRQVTILVECWP
jgi:S1-C subfamily serine protease